MINYLEIISTLLFFSLIGIFLIKDRKNTERHVVIFIRRWKKGLEIIDSLIKKHKRIISIIGSIAVIIGIIGCLLGFVTLISFTIKLQRAFGLVLPTVSGYQIPGPVISIPFWYWLVGAFVLMFVHETSHAIFARLEKVPLKNYGIMLLLLLPIGAFVDPDMKKVMKLKTLKKLKVLAAGSFANYIVAAIVVLLALLMSNLLYEAKGVSFNNTIEKTPAYEANLTGTIKSIDGKEVKSIKDLSKILNETEPGKEIEVETTNATFKIKTVARPDNKTGAYIGINMPREVFDVKWGLQGYNSVIKVTNKLFFWLFILNFGVGTANLLPMKPFDGGLIFEEIANRIFKTKGRYIANIFTLLTIGIILFNLFGIGILKGIIG